MRRKDRKMDENFGKYIIDKSQFGNLSLVDENNKPYIIPLSLVRKENTLYFHSAKEGKKVDLLTDGKYVCISFVEDVRVPNNYSKEELDEIIKDDSKTKILISSVFTTEFASCIVYGKVYLVEDYDEKVKALRLVCEKYTKDKMDYFDKAIEFGLNRTNIYKIQVEKIDSKRKRYGSDKKELKWQKEYS